MKPIPGYCLRKFLVCFVHRIRGRCRGGDPQRNAASLYIYQTNERRFAGESTVVPLYQSIQAIVKLLKEFAQLPSPKLRGVR